MYLCTHRSTQVASPTLSSGSLYMATHLRKHCSVILRAREKRKSTHPECCNAAPRLISPPGRVLHSSNRHRRGHRWRAQEKRSVEASAAAHLLNISVIASSSVCCAACMLAEKKTDRGTSCCVGRPRVCRGTNFDGCDCDRAVLCLSSDVHSFYFLRSAGCTHGNAVPFDRRALGMVALHRLSAERVRPHGAPVRAGV